MPFFRYLVVQNVLSAAISRGCTMLHPGYGFLSENANFVEMCREHGINFIGPNVRTEPRLSFVYLLCCYIHVRKPYWNIKFALKGIITLKICAKILMK